MRGGFGSEDVPELESGCWAYTLLCVHFWGNCRIDQGGAPYRRVIDEIMMFMKILPDSLKGFAFSIYA